MAKKKPIERKPKPAPFLLSMVELNSRLRHGQHRNIAVRLPKELNNLLWITNNFPNDPECNDVTLVVDSLFTVQTLKKQLGFHPVKGDPKKHPQYKNRNVFAIEAKISDLAFIYDTPLENYEVLWWFYSEGDEPSGPKTLEQNFFNHMHYDDTIIPAIIVDKWSGMPSFQNSYIPLSLDHNHG